MAEQLSKREIAIQELREMAGRIFVEMVCRAPAGAQASGPPQPSPDELARLSFKLAESFQRVDSELGSARFATTDGFELTTDAMADWNK